MKKEINFGLAVDVAGKNGARSLVVPNIKNAGAHDLSREYMAAFDDLVARARTGKLAVPDFQGTTISLTNPGTVGTMASMPAAGGRPGRDHRRRRHGLSRRIPRRVARVIASLGISKVMSVTCTYDHRIIQGAESGMFLGKLQALLDGEENFYEEIFEALQRSLCAGEMGAATSSRRCRCAEPSLEVVKEAAVIQLINAYRVRGHLMADLDPLGAEPAYNAELDPLTYGLTIWDLDRHFYSGSLQHAFGDRRQAHAARNDRTAARHLLRQDRLRVHVHPAAGREDLAAGAHGAADRILAASRRKRSCASSRTCCAAEEFEHFLDRRFIGQKRFSLEGAETAIAMLAELANLRAADNGVTKSSSAWRIAAA